MSEDEVRCPYCGSSDYVHGEFDDDPLICNSCGKPFIYTSKEMIRQYEEAHGCRELHMPKLTDEQIQTWREEQGCWKQPIHIEPDSPVWPLPCVRANGKTFEKTTLREWLAKLHEEMTEMEEKAFGICGLDDYPQKEKLYGTHIETEFALECADVATVLASMQEAFGIDLEARNEAQRRVNAKNMERGRL